MRLLEGDDVGLNPVNNEGLTPLAGTGGHEYVGMVEALLGYPGVGLGLGDRERSLFSLVAEAGYEDVLRMNGANADPNSVEGGD